MIAVMPMVNHTTFKTVDTLLDLGADPYQADAEGMTVFDRSRCAYPGALVFSLTALECCLLLSGPRCLAFSGSPRVFCC